MMFVLSNFINAIAVILRIIIDFEIFMIIVSVILSWIMHMNYHPVRQFFDSMAELVVGPIRRWLPFLHIGLVDLSPMVAILLLIFLDSFVVETLFDLARVLR